MAGAAVTRKLGEDPPGKINSRNIIHGRACTCVYLHERARDDFSAAFSAAYVTALGDTCHLKRIDKIT